MAVSTIEPTLVADGIQFPEGPIAMPDGSVILVEIARGTLSRVDHGKISVIAHLGGGPNGAAIGPDGCCYVCNNGGFSWTTAKDGRRFPSGQADDYSGGRIEKVNLESGQVETLYTECDGIPLRGPNDIVFDKTGGFWFTDHGKHRQRDRDLTGIFYAQSDGSHIEEVVFPLESPNGIGLSPDEDEVYVAETPTGRLWGFEIESPGVLSNKRKDRAQGGRLIPGRPGYFFFDSLAVDSQGNVCVATILDGGITILKPSGGAAEHVPLPDRLTTNICFGGEDLRTAYITLSSTGKLVSMPWNVPGLALNFLNK